MTIGNKMDKMINDAQGAVIDDLGVWRNHLPSSLSEDWSLRVMET